MTAKGIVVTTQNNRFNPFKASPETGSRINWVPGFPRRYSPDRKEGIIKRRSGGEIYQEGRSIDMHVILPLPVFSAQMFDQVDEQDGSKKFDNWASIGFVDTRNTPSVIMLADGQTEALRPWLEYLQDIEADAIPIASVITTLSFRPFKSGRGYSYAFSFRMPKSPEEKNRVALIEQWFEKEYPLVYEPTIPYHVVSPILKRLGFTQQEIEASHPKARQYGNEFNYDADESKNILNGDELALQESQKPVNAEDPEAIPF